MDATQKETVIDQQHHSCETLICQRHQTILRLLSSAATARTRWRVRELNCATTYLSETSFHLQLCCIHIKIVLWHVNCCYGMPQCLCSGHVELIVILQVQHINNTQHSNSFTTNDKCRHLSVKILQYKGNDMQFF